MSNKKSNPTYEEENELYVSVKKYVHEKTNIAINYIDVCTASRIQKDSLELWGDFSIVFKDLSTNKIFRLENDKLIEEEAKA